MDTNTRVIDGVTYSNSKPHNSEELKEQENPYLVEQYQVLKMFSLSIEDKDSLITVYLPDYSTYKTVSLDKLLYKGELFLIDERHGIYRISEVDGFEDAYLYYSQVDEIEKTVPVFYMK